MDIEDIKNKAELCADSLTQFRYSPEWLGVKNGYIEGFLASQKLSIPACESLLSLVTSDWWEYGNTESDIERHKDEWRKKLGYSKEDIKQYIQ